MFYVYLLWATSRGGVPAHIWLSAGILALIQAFCLWLSYVSGVRARFLSAANADLMAIHQDSAIRFLWEWGVLIFCVGLVASFRRRRLHWIWHGVILVLFAIQLVEGVRLGHAGGQLLH